MLHLPITMATAGICGLLFFILSFRVVQLRLKGLAPVGDGGHPELLNRMRTHGNFSEYIPLILILMALIEADGGNTFWLKIAGGAAVVTRVLHAIGMPMKAPNFFRASGALGTFIVLVSLSIYAFVLAR